MRALAQWWRDLQVEGAVHVHGHRFDTRTALGAQRFEEGPYRLAAASLGHPQHPPAVGVEDDAGIAMTLEQCELVHDESPGFNGWQRLHLSQQASLVQRSHCAPVQPQPLRHMRHRHPGARLRCGLLQAPRQPGVPGQPRHMLQPLPAARAGQAVQHHLQPHGVAHHGQIPHPPRELFMDARTLGQAMPAAQWHGRVRLEPDLHLRPLGLQFSNTKARPERQGVCILVHWSGALGA